MSRELTAEEVRHNFLSQIKTSKEYWLGLNKSVEETIDGVIFSILVLLDGGSYGFPACRVCPCPHPEDKVYHNVEGTDWYPENHEVQLNGEITGDVELHHVWCKSYGRDRVLGC